jgi:hypothetical protein
VSRDKKRHAKISKALYAFKRGLCIFYVFHFYKAVTKKNKMKNKINRLVVSDCLSWYFFPQAFVAELKVERLLVRLEGGNDELNKKVEEKVDELIKIKKEITDALGVKAGSNLIFDIDLTDGYIEGVVDKRKLIFPIQKRAFGIFRDICNIVGDDKVFDYCP